jgi:hypothetical protein
MPAKLRDQEISDDRLSEFLASHFRSGGSGDETKGKKTRRDGTKGGNSAALFKEIKSKIKAINIKDNEEGLQAIQNLVEEYERTREEKNHEWQCLVQ